MLLLTTNVYLLFFVAFNAFGPTFVVKMALLVVNDTSFKVVVIVVVVSLNIIIVYVYASCYFI